MVSHCCHLNPIHITFSRDWHKKSLSICSYLYITEATQFNCAHNNRWCSFQILPNLTLFVCSDVTHCLSHLWTLESVLPRLHWTVMNEDHTFSLYHMTCNWLLLQFAVCGDSPLCNPASAIPVWSWSWCATPHPLQASWR